MITIQQRNLADKTIYGVPPSEDETVWIRKQMLLSLVAGVLAQA